MPDGLDVITSSSRSYRAAKTFPAPEALLDEGKRPYKKQTSCMTYEEAGDLKLQLNNVRVDNKMEKNCKHLLKNRKLMIFYQE